MSVAVLPVAAALGFFSPQILGLWTQDALLTDKTYLLVRVMTVSAAVNGLLTIPHALLLAHGHTRIPLWTHVIAIVVLTPVTIWTTLRYGALGATAGWAAYNFLNLMVGMHFIHRLFLPGERRRWYVEDVGRPAAVAVSLVAAGWLLLPRSLPPLPLAVAIALVLACSAAATARAAPRVWETVRSVLSARQGEGGLA
jgi:O-antigen/teichoic acid export membrane protein